MGFFLQDLINNAGNSIGHLFNPQPQQQPQRPSPAQAAAVPRMLTPQAQQMWLSQNAPQQQAQAPRMFGSNFAQPSRMMNLPNLPNTQASPQQTGAYTMNAVNALKGIPIGIANGIGNTGAALGDVGAGAIANFSSNPYMKQAAAQQFQDHFNQSIPGGIYHPISLLGNTIGATLAGNTLLNQGMDANIVTNAMNERTSPYGINTDNNSADNARKIAAASAETALNIATAGSPVTGSLKSQVGAQTGKVLAGDALKTALQQKAAQEGTSLLTQAVSSGRANAGIGAASGLASALQQDNVTPGNILQNVATGAAGGLVMGTATPYIHAGASNLGRTAADNAPRAIAHDNLMKTDPQYANAANQATTLANTIDQAQKAGVPQAAVQPHIAQLNDLTNQMAAKQDKALQGGFAKVPGANTQAPVTPPNWVDNSLTKGGKAGKQNISPETQANLDTQHQVRNTQALQDTASANADKVGLDATIQSAHDALAVPMGKIDDATVAHVQQAIERADAAGNFQAASDLHNALSEHLTKQGQTIQAASLLYQRSPQGLLYKAERDIAKSAGKDAVTPELHTKLQGLADGIKQATDQSAKELAVAKFHKAVADQIPQSKLQGAVSVWKAGLLSGPITHAGNAASNATFGLLKKVSDVPAAATDATLAAIGKTQLGKKMGLTGDRTKTLTMRGIGSGTAQGFSTAKETLTTGIDRRNISGNKYEAHGELNFKNPVIQKVFGDTSNGVFRAMSAGDQPFYYAAAKNSLYDQALAAGKNQGLKGRDLQSFAKNNVDNPSAKMATQAQKDAQYAVLSQDNVIGSAVSKFTQAHPALQVAVPFTKVPTNFLSETLDYTPVGAIKNVIQQVKDIKNGQGLDQRSFSEAIGRSATGTGIMVLGSALAAHNLLSGQYPSGDQKEAQRWKAEGITPNSVKIGNTWIGLNYLGPTGMLLQAGKDWNDAAARGDNQAMAAIGGFGKSLTGQSFLTGFSSIANALQDPQRFGPNFVNSLAGSVVPNVLNQVAQAFDSQQRQADNPLQTIQSRIPGAREGLKAKQDVYGNPLDTRTDPLNMLLNPLRPSNANNSPTIDEVNRLHTANPNDKNLQVTPTPVNSSVSLGNGNNVKLTKDQQYALQTAVGQETQKQWGQLIQTPQYQAANDTQKADMLTRLRTSAEQAATRQYVAMNGLGSFAKGASSKVASVMNGTGDVNSLSASSKSGLAGVNTSIDKTYQDTLTKYGAMNPADRTKALKSSNDALYQYNLARYQNDKANGKISGTQDVARQAALARDKIGANFSPTTRDMYAMSKTNLTTYLKNDPNGQQDAQAVMAYDKALKDAGINKTLKYSNGTISTASSRTSTGRTRSSGGTRRASSRSTGKAAAKSSLAAITKATKASTSMTSALNQKVASAKVTNVSKRGLPTMKKPGGNKMAAFKQPKVTKISQKRSA